MTKQVNVLDLHEIALSAIKSTTIDFFCDSDWNSGEKLTSLFWTGVVEFNLNGGDGG